MSRTTLVRLRDAQDYAYHALSNACGLEAELLAQIPQPLHAALYDLAILGEALSKVPQEVRSLAPDIPSNGVIGTRNHIVHAYWQVDHALVADILEHRLEPLITALGRLIDMLEQADA